MGGGRAIQKLVGIGVMTATLAIVTTTVAMFSVFSNPTISQATITPPPPTQITQEAPTQQAITPTTTQITSTLTPPTLTATPDINPIPEDAPPMAMYIIDNENPITQEEISQLVEPNLVLISQISNQIRTVNPARIRIDKSVIPALESLYQAAEADHVNLSIRSGYRSYEDQARSSSAASDKTTVVLPGYSQHHSGLAMDFTTIDIGYVVDVNAHFENTKAGKWLAEHAWEYGFIPAYTQNHQGIANESWHYIYVGKTLARMWHDSQSTNNPFDYFTLIDSIKSN